MHCTALQYLAGRKLGDSLGSLTDSMLGKFTWKHETDSRLDFSARQCCLLVVSGQLSGFGGNAFKDIVDERVHDGHALFGDTGIGVDLLEDLVDIRRISLGTLLVFLSAGRGLLGCLGRYFGGSLGHFGICV